MRLEKVFTHYPKHVPKTMVVVLVVSNIAFGTLHDHVLDYKLFELLYPGRDLQVWGLCHLLLVLVFSVTWSWLLS